MQCPSCGFGNQAEMNFCGKCGTRLANVCAGCGYTNPPDHTFCGKCGTSLTSQPPAPTSSQSQQQPVTPQEAELSSYTPSHLAEKILTSRSALEGERKQVTVMFADIILQPADRQPVEDDV